MPPERQFVDDGVSRATLVRPGLDQLRDGAAVGAIDRAYVHSPDRLARNYAYQVLLLDEFVQKVEIKRENIKIVFRVLQDAGRSGPESIAVMLPR